MSAVTKFGVILRDNRTAVTVFRGDDGRVHFEFKDRLVPLLAQGTASELSGIEAFAAQYIQRLEPYQRSPS